MEELKKETTGVLVLDMQDQILSTVERPLELQETLCSFLRACQIFQLPLVVTEQSHKGPVAPKIRGSLDSTQKILIKDSFSAWQEEPVRQAIENASCTHWILVGAEAHISVLQTARDLRAAGKKVVVINDGVSSRSIFDFSTAIAELKDCGARISSSETVLFELLRSTAAPEYEKIAELVR